MTDRLFGLISLCRKAGRLKVGFDPVLDSISDEEAEIVLLASDLSEKTEKKFIEESLKREFPRDSIFKVRLSKDELGDICGKAAGVISITDSGFADGMRQLIAET